jgi:hypothetical protein
LLGAAIGSGGTAATWTAVVGAGFSFAQSAGSFNSVAGDGRYGVQYGLGDMGGVWAP